jgi:class 3 adenylate cyclase/tetratricopeptide (TPR) repeat protein
MVFSDISGFTRLSEQFAKQGRAGGEQLVTHLNTVFRDLLRESIARGGDFLLFGGDALLLLFDGDGHASRAAEAAHAMRRALVERKAIDTGRGRVRLRISQGVHSGRFRCTVAGERHRQLFVLGADVTRLLALEAAAEAQQVLVSEETAARIPRAWRAAHRDGAVSLRFADSDSRSWDGADSASLGSVLMKFVPAQLRRHVRRGFPESGHRHAAIGFVKVSDLDRRIEEDPDEVCMALRRFVQDIEDAAKRYGACPLQSDIVPDGAKLLIVAGVPDAIEDPEAAILRTLLDTTARDHGLQIQAGVNAGSVFACDAGSPERRAFTVLGDSVNLAARLMTRSNPGAVLSTLSTLEAAGPEFARTELPPFSVKGKRELVEAALVTGIIDRARRAKHDTLPFVAREREMETLREAVLAGTTSAAIEVVGDEGIGKTRLALAALGERPSTQVLWFASESGQRLEPYFLSSLVLRALLGCDAAAPAAAVERALTERLAPHPELKPWIPLIGVAARIDITETPEIAAVAPKFRATVLVNVVVDAIRVLVQEPLTLVLDDLQWADDASFSIVARLADSAERPVGIIALRRTSDTRPLTMRDGVSLVLMPLPDAAVRDALRGATDQAPISERKLVTLTERSGGNPLFATQLLNASREGALLDTLPSSVEALVGSRIDRLPPDARRLVRALAVIGRRVPVGLAYAVLGDEFPELRTYRIPRGLGAHLVRRDGDWEFRHTILHDVAYSGLSFARRRFLHARVADVLAGHPVEPAELSWHLFAAGRFSDAWRASLKAADDARRRFDSSDAAALYSRTLEAIGHARDAPPTVVVGVAEALGDVAELVGDYERADTAYARARLHAPRDGIATARLLRKAGRIAFFAGRHRAAQVRLGRAQKVLQGHDASPEVDAERSQVAYAAAAVLWEEGRIDRAMTRARDGYRLACRSGDDAAVAHSAHQLDLYLTLSGRPDHGVRIEAMKRFERLEDTLGQALVTNNAGIEAQRDGRWRDAREAFERAHAMRRAAGDVNGAMAMVHNLGEMCSDAGLLDEAEQHLSEAWRVWSAGGSTLPAAGALSGLGRVHARAGRADQALSALERALDEFETHHAEWWALEAELRIAEALVLNGRPIEAVPWLDRADDRSRRVDLLELRPLHERLHGLIALARGDRDAAMTFFAASLASADDLNSRFDEAETLEARAKAHVEPAQRADDLLRAQQLRAALVI